MHLPRKTIALPGGSGFIGRHLAPLLAQRGHRVAVLTRQSPDAIRWRTFTGVSAVRVDPRDRASLTEALKPFDTVINLIGILSESRNSTFKAAHSQTVSNLVHCAQHHGIHRIVHISAIGADANKGTSRYLRSKGEAEQFLHTYIRNKAGVTIFRPSVIFGDGDGFVCRMARLLPRLLKPVPILPLPRARVRMAPVYIGDLCRMIADSLDEPEYFGASVDVCGPHTFVLADLMRLISQTAGVDPVIIEMPDWLGRWQSAILGMLPGQLMTSDQFDSLAIDSVSVGAKRGTTHLSSMLPGMIREIQRRDPFSGYRRSARRE